MAHELPRASQASTIVCIVVNVLISCIDFYVILQSQIKARLSSKDEEEEEMDNVYEDEDGVASGESKTQPNALIPHCLASFATVLGLLLSLSLAIYRTWSHRGRTTIFVDDWLSFASWVLLALLTSLVIIQRHCITKFTYGILCAAASIAVFLSVLIQLYFNLLTPIIDNHAFAVVATSLQAVSALVLCIACLSFPRRPAVELEGHQVDRQYTVSALFYGTMAWSMDVLTLARSKENLDMDDLPLLNYKARSAFLLGWLGTEADKRALWKTLLYMHSPEIVFQSVFAIVQAALQFAPQLVMYELLSLLEQRSGARASIVNAWILVVALGASMIMSAWGDTWIAWIGYSRLGLQIRSEISALVFAKATRRKDVKGSTRNDNPDAEDSLIATIEQSGLPVASLDGPTSGFSPASPEDEVEKTRQSTINLVSVDAKRVSDFLRYHYLFVQVATEFVVSLVFLVKLLGWLPVIAGFAVFFLALPLNIWTSKRFTDAEGDLMAIRDRKLMVLTEALQGIRQIKFSAQEARWQNRIRSVRSTELDMQWRVFCLDTILMFCWILGPILLSAVALAVYTALHSYLSASIAFTSITVFASLEFTLAVVPQFTADGLEAWVSAKRINEYLKAPEREKYTTDDNKIIFEDVTIAWPSDSTGTSSQGRFTLRDLNIKVPSQQLTVISGATGAGKSLLLASIIGEADLLSGVIKAPVGIPAHVRYDNKVNRSDWIMDSAVAFVAQIPWIENATIKANIMFGLPYDRGRYNKVIECCALKKDLEILDDGDNTDIGFNGINLSGGQRWRVTFARALYSRAGILVLDDIFSAVDAHVGRSLFEDALTGELGQGRTRILVTHHVGLVLPKAAYIIALGDGTIKYAGTPESLDKTGGLEQVTSHESITSQKLGKYGLANVATIDDDYDLKKIMSAASHKSNRIDSGGFDEFAKNMPKKFVEDETKERGSVKLGMYAEYFSNSGGIWFWLPILALFAGHQALGIGRSWFVSLWTRSYESEAITIYSILQMPLFKEFDTPKSHHGTNLSFYLGIYLGLSILLCITGTLRYFTVYMRSIEASKTMFERMTFTILRTPLRWLDTVPVGRVLNRFTADFEAIDSDLGGDLAFVVYEVLQLLGIIVAAVFVSPLMLLIAVLLLGVCGWVTSWYLAGAREVKRLESIAKSPIFELFGATLSGVATIRAFDKVDIYLERMFHRIDGHARAFWHLWLFNRWVAFNLEIVGAVFATAVAAFVTFADIDASLAGFALSFALQYSSAVVWATRFYSNVELSMNSVERVSEYSNLPIEEQGGKLDPPAAWPTEGRLEVNDLVVGYAPDLPAVLKGLSFSVEKNQRVGVVGRTGAGKSSLTLALFRFLEARSGSIHIDGINTADIPLQILRSRLAIIPQDPVLFSGTVRSNVDPFDEHTDIELRDALQRVHLTRSTGAPSRDELADPQSSRSIDTNTNPSITLNSPISESGLNLSQGQRQLLCLARAIVSRPKLLVLDEATSAVDMATDLLIQRSIREEFQDSTLLVIAHRLSTIADFDRILVMAEGKGVEFGSPRELLGVKGGVFTGLVEESGEKAELRKVIGSEGK